MGAIAVQSVFIFYNAYKLLNRSFRKKIYCNAIVFIGKYMHVQAETWLPDQVSSMWPNSSSGYFHISFSTEAKDIVVARYCYIVLIVTS